MYEFTSHHLLRDTQLETTLRSTFDRIADAPNAAPASADLRHADGGLRTFTARFERFEDAKAFRSALAEDPEADAHVSPRIDELEPIAPPRVALDWNEPTERRPRLGFIRLAGLRERAVAPGRL